MRPIFASAHSALDDADVITLPTPTPSAYVPDPTITAKLEMVLHDSFDRFEHEQALSDKLYPVALEALHFALTNGTTVALMDPYGPFVVVGILSTIGGHQFCFKEASARGFSGGAYNECNPLGLHEHCRLLVNRLNRFMKPSPLRVGDSTHRQTVLNTEFTWAPCKV